MWIDTAATHPPFCLRAAFAVENDNHFHRLANFFILPCIDSVIEAFPHPDILGNHVALGSPRAMHSKRSTCQPSSTHSTNAVEILSYVFRIVLEQYYIAIGEALMNSKTRIFNGRFEPRFMIGTVETTCARRRHHFIEGYSAFL